MKAALHRVGFPEGNLCGAPGWWSRRLAAATIPRRGRHASISRSPGDHHAPAFLRSCPPLPSSTPSSQFLGCSPPTHTPSSDLSFRFADKGCWCSREGCEGFGGCGFVGW